MPKATITSKGQVTIPKPVRDRLGLRSGDRLDFTVEPDGTITVEPLDANGEERPLAGYLKDRVKLRKPVTVEDMDRGLEEAVAREYLGSIGARGERGSGDRD